MPAPIGKLASQGKGPQRYSIRLPLWPAENVCFKEAESLHLDECLRFSVMDRDAEIEKREVFLILWIRDFATESEARNFLSRVALGLIRLAAEKTAAIQFQHLVTEIAMGPHDPNLPFRERLDPAMYPPDWNIREDGSRTDGGIFSHGTYIIPEHQRIWEYNLCFMRVIRPIGASDFVRAIEKLSDANPAAVLADQPAVRAIRAFWDACAEPDRAERYVQLVKTLDTLTGDDRAGKPGGQILKEIKDIIISAKTQSASREELIKALQDIDSKIPIAMSNRIRALMAKVFPDDNELPGKVLGLRGKFAHQGGQQPPPADEVEELHKVVWAHCRNPSERNVAANRREVDLPLR
jgi:hypothetical protein